MGSPETGAGVVDCSVGSIVWVRRRNGSWWPGKILGPDELSASHVMSPRSGTPVKLLGREDASVDWYNLEKSKRVKAFRCGEFDDCIERAEASQGMPPKKREKYARREDAILHALELEKQMLEKKYGKKGHSSIGKHNKSTHDVKKELAGSSENLEMGNRKQLHPKTHQERKTLSLTVDDKVEDQYLFSESAKEENQPSLDDDNSGVLPRMRGLQDLGLQTAPPNLKTSSLAPSNGSHKPVFDSSAHNNLDGGLGMEGTINGTSENSSEKRKRSHDCLGEDSIAKRRDRRRPLVQVLQNSSKLPVSHSPPDGSVNFTSMSEDEEQPGVMFHEKKSRYAYLASESRDDSDDTKNHSTRVEMLPAKFEESISVQRTELYEEQTIGSTEDTETDSSETDSLDSDSVDLASLSEGAVSIELQPKYPGRSEARQEYGSLSSEEVDDLALADDVSHPSHNDPASTSMGVSRWQLKGKRNNRSLIKRLPDGTSRSFPRGTADETSIEMGTSGCNGTYSIDKNLGPRMALYGCRGPDGISSRNIQWEHWDWSQQPAIKGYWEDSGEFFDPVFVSRHDIGGRIMLVDVDLKVQSSYQREHVPMISLMSKINGQAIVGHPIQIEALENGSSESLLVETDDWCPEILENDAALSPMWRTARRTANFRVPRPDLSSTSDESPKHLQFVDGRKGSSGRSNAGTYGHKTGTMGKRIAPLPVDRKFSRKPLKKISLSSNQKIRTLSSIASQQKQNSEPKCSGNNYDVDGLIKPESLPTAVACIPVKLVFSRLQEELVGRHP